MNIDIGEKILFEVWVTCHPDRKNYPDSCYIVFNNFEEANNYIVPDTYKKLIVKVVEKRFFLN